jgi:hypothetical protein
MLDPRGIPVCKPAGSKRIALNGITQVGNPAQAITTFHQHRRDMGRNGRGCRKQCRYTAALDTFCARSYHFWNPLQLIVVRKDTLDYSRHERRQPRNTPVPDGIVFYQGAIRPWW